MEAISVSKEDNDLLEKVQNFIRKSLTASMRQKKLFYLLKLQRF